MGADRWPINAADSLLGTLRCARTTAAVIAVVFQQAGRSAEVMSVALSDRPEEDVKKGELFPDALPWG
jgi:hypothetical protein